MKRMKKLTALILSILLILSGIGAVGAEDVTITVLGKEYTHTTNSPNTNTWGGSSVSFASATLTYSVTAEVEGAYMLQLWFGTNQAMPVTMGIEVNGNALGNFAFTEITGAIAASGFSAQESHDTSVCWLNEGRNTIKIACSGANAYMSQFILIKQDASSLTGSRETLRVGEADYAENGVYPRGTEVICAGYDTAIMSGSFTGVTLQSEKGDSVPLVCSAQDASKTLQIALAGTLDYGTEYTLLLKDVRDMYGNTMAEESFTFTTSAKGEADTGAAEITLDSFEIADSTAVVTGKVTTGLGVGVAGRKVEFWLQMPGVQQKLVVSDMTGENGVFALSYALPASEDNSGTCIATVKTEYTDEAPGEVFEYISPSDLISFVGKDYSKTTSGSSTNLSGSSVYIGAGVTLTYTVNAVKAGGYDLSAIISSYQERAFTLTLEVNGGEVGVYSYDPEGSASNFGVAHTYGPYPVWLESGENTFKITSDEQVMYQKFTFLRQAAGILESIKIGGRAYEENGIYARGTDVIAVTYSAPIDAATIAGISVQDSAGNLVDAVCSLGMDGKTIFIAFAETLDYETTYTVVLSGLKDAYSYAMAEESFSFTTGSGTEDEEDCDTAIIDSFIIKNGVATITGTVVGSTQVGISGRNVEFYLTLPGGTKEKVAEGITTAGGAFTFTYRLPAGDIAEVCVAEIHTPYDILPAIAEYYYVSPGILGPILETLSNTTQGSGTDATSVQYVLEENEDILKINLESDLAGIEPSGFYDLLVGALTDSTEAFQKTYTAALAIETINQATVRDAVKTILNNENYLAALDIENTQLSALNTTGKNKLCDLLLAADRIESKTDFDTLFNGAFNAGLMEQAGLSDITLVTSTASAKVGQSTSFSLKTTENFKNIKKFTLLISFDGVLEDELAGVDVISNLGDVNLEETDDGVLCTILVSEPANATKNLATLQVAGGTVGSGTAYVSGTAFGETGTEYDAECPVHQQTYELTVTAQTSSNPVKGGGGGGGRPSGSGSAIKPVAVPTQSADTAGSGAQSSTATEKTFTDIDGVAWAQEAILDLLDNHVITMPEEKMFYPNRNVTRAEFLKMLVLASGTMVHGGAEVNFTDVSQDDWYYQYIQASVNKKIVTGDENGCFRPNDYITREDMCVILARYLGAKEETPEELFTDDADISTYAKYAVYHMKNTGIINGVGDNMFAPKGNATRAMAAKVIYLLKEGA